MSNAAHVLFPLAGLVAAGAVNEWSRTAEPAALTFTVTGPGSTSFQGKTAAVDVQETDQSVVVVVDLRDLQTGNALRDKLMKEEHLEVDQHPFARLEMARAELVLPDVGSPIDPPSLDDDVTGLLSLHGEQREVAFHYEATCNAAWLCDVVGDAVVVMSQFGIPVPRWQGALLHPDVKVHVEFQVQRAAPPMPPPDAEPEPPPTLPPPPQPTPN
ncbi:MAG: YceI family protein [Deltaproteobacteria bacterium]|nr:YceI family protein [Deltaproteobacteria bacterium]